MTNKKSSSGVLRGRLFVICYLLFVILNISHFLPASLKASYDSVRDSARLGRKRVQEPAEELRAAFEIADRNKFVAGVRLFDRAWANCNGGDVLFREKSGVTKPWCTDAFRTEIDEFLDEGVSGIGVERL
jgi:hypothetical protein